MPNLIAIIHSNPTASIIFSYFLYVWALAGAICLFTSKVTDAQLATLNPRFAALIRALRHFSLNTLPFLQELWIVVRGVSAASAAMLLFMVKIVAISGVML